MDIAKMLTLNYIQHSTLTIPHKIPHKGNSRPKIFKTP
jgi:hypothetical protein